MTQAAAGALRRFEHYRDRGSPPSYTWLTGESWQLSFPLALTARVRPPGWNVDGVPEPVAALFAWLWGQLDQGLVLVPGTVVDCGADAPWGEFPRALVCVPVPGIGGVPVAPDTLGLVGLHADELAALAVVGKGRVLAHLGYLDGSGAARATDWTRPSVADRLGLDATELARLPCASAPGWSLMSRRAGLTLRMDDPGDSAAAAHLAALQPGEAMVLLQDPAWDVRPSPPWPAPPIDQERPEVVGAWTQAGDGTGVQDGHSPAFFAVALAPEAEHVENLEDGLVLWLKANTLALLVAALSQRQPLDHDFPDHTVLRVRLVQVKPPPAKVDEHSLALPERPAVTMPSPVFTASERWHTFTTPFRRVYPGAKK